MKRAAFISLLLLIVLLFNTCNKDDEETLFIASDFVTLIDENPTDGMVIGKIIAAASKGDITYTLSSTNPSGAFVVSSTTGVLTVANPGLFDYETNPVITGVAEVTCDGDEKTVNISIYLNNITTVFAGIYSQAGMTGNPGFGSNYLLGTKHTLLQSGTLLSLNLIGRNTGARVQMALYEDNNNVPGDLVTVSEQGVVNTDGIVSLDVTPVKIPAGNYWIMAVYDISGNHSWATQTVNHTVYFTALSFGNTVPNNAADFITYTGYNFAYFMTVE